MPSSRLGGKEHGQQVLSVCLVRIFIEVRHVGNYVCRNVALLHLAWVGEFASTPHPLTVLCIYARLLAYMGLMWKGLILTSMADTYCTWAMVACRSLTALGGRGATVSPSTGSCPHYTICLYKNWNSILISKLTFKHILELFSMETSSDSCLCTQLAMSISP
jgi:hypothetical protein